jgi:hypothetical protein
MSASWCHIPGWSRKYLSKIAIIWFDFIPNVQDLILVITAWSPPIIADAKRRVSPGAELRCADGGAAKLTPQPDLGSPIIAHDGDLDLREPRCWLPGLFFYLSQVVCSAT